MINPTYIIAWWGVKKKLFRAVSTICSHAITITEFSREAERNEFTKGQLVSGLLKRELIKYRGCLSEGFYPRDFPENRVLARLVLKLFFASSEFSTIECTILHVSYLT